MQTFLKSLRDLVAKNPTHLLITFGENNTVSVVTTFTRNNKPDVPVLIKGDIDEVALNYFSEMAKPVDAINAKMISTADNAAQAVAKETDKPVKTVKAPAKPVKSKAEIEAEKQKEKETKSLEKLSVNPYWKQAVSAFNLQHWGIARTQLLKVVSKEMFKDLQIVKNLMATCEVKAGFKTAEQAFVEGAVEIKAEDLQTSQPIEESVKEELIVEENSTIEDTGEKTETETEETETFSDTIVEEEQQEGETIIDEDNF